MAHFERYGGGNIGQITIGKILADQEHTGILHTRNYIHMIRYESGNQIDLDEVIELYRASTLGERRPVDDRARMGQMLAHANLVITAWDGDLLVGIARSVTDFVYVTYLADLAVRLSHQRHGIGRELIHRTQQAGSPETRLVLLAAPKAVDYYPHIGFVRHEQCWQIEPGKQVVRKQR